MFTENKKLRQQKASAMFSFGHAAAHDAHHAVRSHLAVVPYPCFHCRFLPFCLLSIYICFNYNMPDYSVCQGFCGKIRRRQSESRVNGPAQNNRSFSVRNSIGPTPKVPGCQEISPRRFPSSTALTREETSSFP
jgi:hypothetical protein